MRFTPQILDEIRARLPVSQVVGRKVALKKKGREFWGLSPFKSEKTPSFSVNDAKGFYHCFATQEHGDIFTFLIKTEGVSFPEAVERLAAEAGVQLPKNHTANPKRENERERLFSIMAQSAEFFTKQLGSTSGRTARDYLAGRQLSDGTISAFGLGYAPDSYHALKDFLSDAGFSESETISSGMIVGGQDIRRSYDRFRHRVIFPIHDLKGRIIAFGGRALRPDDPAKYLNSPETPLFHKGHVLYNAHRAKEAAFRAGEAIAVEGYMDAIALAQAGHMQTVAPLGTALTAEQLQMLWRMAPEPVMCFDGDAAGRRAAYRALDTALPFLKPGYSLRFAFLSDGLDPDDLIRQQGGAAFRAVIDRAQTLADVLWQREWEAGDWATPERRAAFEANLRALVEQISDPSVKSYYDRMLIRERLFNAWRSPPRKSTKSTYKTQQGKQNTNLQSKHTNHLQSDPLITGEGHNFNREASLIRALINHPWLLVDFAETIAELDFSFDLLQRLQNALLILLSDDLTLDTATIRHQLNLAGLQKDVELIDRSATHKCDLFAEPDTEDAEVEKGWRIAILPHRIKALRKNIETADKEFQATGDDEAASRILELSRHLSVLEAFSKQLDD